MGSAHHVHDATTGLRGDGEWWAEPTLLIDDGWWGRVPRAGSEGFPRDDDVIDLG